MTEFSSVEVLYLGIFTERNYVHFDAIPFPPIVVNLGKCFTLHPGRFTSAYGSFPPQVLVVNITTDPLSEIVLSHEVQPNFPTLSNRKRN